MLAPSSGQIPNRTYNPKRLIYPYFNFLGWVLFFKRIFDAGCLFPETNPTQTRRISFNEADNQLQESPKTCQRSTNYFLLSSSLTTITGKRKKLLKIYYFGYLMSWRSAKDQFQLEINAWNTGNWAPKCLRKFCPGLEITF